MLCDELWMMCVKAHQQDLWREVEHHALQQRVQAQMPRRHRAWWHALSQAIIGCRVRLHAFWLLRSIRQTDEPEALWERVKVVVARRISRDTLTLATVQVARALQRCHLK